MSPQGSPPESSSAGRVASEPRRIPAWLVIGGAVLAAVVAVGAVVVVVAARESSRGPAGELLRAPVEPMPRRPVAQGGAVPSDCGISTTTLERVLKRIDDRNHSSGAGHRRCSWLSERDGTFQLSADIFMAADPSQGPTGNLNNQVKVLSRETPFSKEEPLKVVEHLGDETYAHYRAGRRYGEATIIMRAGNSVARLTHSGSVLRGAPAESQLMPSALEVTREIGEKLGVAVAEEPKIATIPQGQPAVSARKAACATLSERTRQRLAGRPYTPPGRFGWPTFRFAAPVHDNPRMDTCSWSGETGTVRVETMTLADPPEGAHAQAARTLDWLQWRTREEGISRAPDASAVTLFTLTGRGDGAYAAYEPPSRRAGGYGLVAFQIHNAVVRVTYTAAFKRRLTQDQAVNGAYTAAVEVAATFTP
jgi:hypothetical protein